MTTQTGQHETLIRFDKHFYSEQVTKLCGPAVQHFRKITRAYAFFSFAFLTLLSAELALLFVFFSMLTATAMLALTLAALFLTVFSYFVLRLYFQAKKPDQFLELKDQYLNACKQILNYQEGIPEHHIALANASSRFGTALRGQEYAFYKPPRWLEAFAPALEKFSCWWHWHDVYSMRELLLLTSIDEHIKLVKCEPTDLEVHAALANAYVTLSGLYADPRKNERDGERWRAPQKYGPEVATKFRTTAERAIEEFKILNDYAPDDPWVHTQLAYSYHDLQMPEEEIHEYETILKLRPNDRETLFKLGVLYFQQGQNAKGLHAYEDLRRSHPKKAEDLLKFYGTF